MIVLTVDEGQPEPTPFKVYLMTSEARALGTHARRADERICIERGGYQICRSPSRGILRGVLSGQENLALASSQCDAHPYGGPGLAAALFLIRIRTQS